MLRCKFSFVRLMAYAGSLLLLLIGCTDKSKSSVTTENDGNISRVEIKLNPEYYNQVYKNTDRIAYVILNEDEDNMFIDLDKLLIVEGNYYILDRYSSRSVLSFSSKGEPLHKYGRG